MHIFILTCLPKLSAHWHKHNIISILIVLVTLVLASSPYAANEQNTQARENLNNILSSIKSIKGEFTQHEYDSDGHSLRILKGKFTMAPPLLLRWEIFHPFTQTIISNGTNTLIYDDELKQMIIRPLDKKNLPFFFFLEGNKNILNKMEIIQPDKKAPIFLLYDVDKSQEILVYFRNKLPREINWHNELNQKVVLKFTNLKKNRRIKRAEFNFTPPPGIDIIQEK